jgi:hypothetical protein
MSETYHGPADVALLFIAGEQARTEYLSGQRVLLEPRMPGLYALTGLPLTLDGCARAQVELPDGRVLAGAVTSTGPGRLLFRLEGEG